MKRLLVFRHGKSAWDADYSVDFERPLAPRGRKAARTMGRFLAKLGQAPDLVLTSSAVRAETTARLAADAGRWDCPIEAIRELYDASTETVLSLVHKQDDKNRSLLLAGHEPTSSELVARLVGGGQITFPTAAMARVDVDADLWKEVRFGDGFLIWLMTPKLLKRSGLATNNG